MRATGIKNELYTCGGEFVFISKLINDSIIHHDKVIWFSSLIGKKATYFKLKNKLKNTRFKRKILILFDKFMTGKQERYIVFWSYIVDKVDKRLKINKLTNSSNFHEN